MASNEARTAKDSRAVRRAIVLRNEYDSPVPQVQNLSAPSPLRGELIAAFNALIRRIEQLEADRG